MKRIAAALLLGVLVLWSGFVRADVYNHVEIDVSALAGHNIKLALSLSHNNDVWGDSWARIDNVRLDELLDFESEEDALIGWSLDLEVGRRQGTLTGAGGWLMEMDEGSGWPVMAIRDFYSIPGDSVLSFDVQTNLSPDSGEYGLDEFVVDVYNWDDTTGASDLSAAFVASADGITSLEDITKVSEAEVVPAPGALLLGLLGFGAGGLGLWRGRNRLV